MCRRNTERRIADFAQRFRLGSQTPWICRRHHCAAKQPVRCPSAGRLRSADSEVADRRATTTLRNARLRRRAALGFLRTLRTLRCQREQIPTGAARQPHGFGLITSTFASAATMSGGWQELRFRRLHMPRASCGQQSASACQADRMDGLSGYCRQDGLYVAGSASGVWGIFRCRDAGGAQPAVACAASVQNLSAVTSCTQRQTARRRATQLRHRLEADSVSRFTRCAASTRCASMEN